MKNEEWVEVAAVGKDEEATLIAGLLESEGIPCEVEGPSSTHPLPENLGSFGMSRIMTPPEHASRARELLADRERAFDEGAEVPAAPDQTEE